MTTTTIKFGPPDSDEMLLKIMNWTTPLNRSTLSSFHDNCRINPQHYCINAGPKLYRGRLLCFFFFLAKLIYTYKRNSFTKNIFNIKIFIGLVLLCTEVQGYYLSRVTPPRSATRVA